MPARKKVKQYRFKTLYVDCRDFIPVGKALCQWLSSDNTEFFFEYPLSSINSLKLTTNIYIQQPHLIKKFVVMKIIFEYYL